MGLQDVIRWLLPREDSFFQIMERQAAIAVEAARALARFGEEGVTADEVRAAVQEVEHRGDVLSHEIEAALHRTFVTPIDREDIQSLSAALDDITDRMNQTARSFSLFDVTEPTAAMRAQMALLIQTTTCLEKSLPLLGRWKLVELGEQSRAMKELEKAGDNAYRTAIAELFRDPALDAKSLLRQKEILELLEATIDGCEDVAELLAHLAVKHG